MDREELESLYNLLDQASSFIYSVGDHDGAYLADRLDAKAREIRAMIDNRG